MPSVLCGQESNQRHRLGFLWAISICLGSLSLGINGIKNPVEVQNEPSAVMKALLMKELADLQRERDAIQCEREV